MKRLFPFFLAFSMATPAISGPFETALDFLAAGQSSKAVAQFQLAAGTGHGEAQFNLAVMLAKGDGILQNDQDALFWAWRARMSGVKRAVTLVDYLYTRLPVDGSVITGTSLELTYSDLFQNGNADAALAMGRIHNEIYPERNVEMAYKWFTIAAALDVKYAKAFREAVAYELDAVQRSSMQRQAKATLKLWCLDNAESSALCGVLHASAN